MDLMSPSETSFLQTWLQKHQSESQDDPAGTSSGASASEHEAGFVTSLYLLCAQQLSRFTRILVEKAALKGQQRRRIKHLQGQLHLFGDSFEHGKIESCLNADDDIRQSVLSLLFEIGKILSEVIFYHATPSTALADLVDDEITSDLRSHVSRARDILEMETSEIDIPSSSSSDEEDVSKLQQVEKGFERRVLQPLGKYVELLMDLFPTLEQTYRIQHQSRAPKPVTEIHLTAAAYPYILNVRDKFPTANSFLIERLGEANWQRHERLRATAADGAENVPAFPSSLPAKSLFQPISIFKDSALGSSIRAQSTRTATVASHSSFISSVRGTETENGGFRVPQMPDHVEGEVFPCPFCKKDISLITDRVQWKLHVFADLQAYICTSSNCSDVLRTFPSRKAWFEHETLHHLSRTQYHCQLCDDKYDSDDTFLNHSRTAHAISTATDSLKKALLKAASVPLKIAPQDLRCTLCLQTGWTKYRDYATHVGKHLENIALCALPPNLDNDTDTDISASEASGGNLKDNMSDTSVHQTTKLLKRAHHQKTGVDARKETGTVIAADSVQVVAQSSEQSIGDSKHELVGNPDPLGPDSSSTKIDAVTKSTINVFYEEDETQDFVFVRYNGGSTSNAPTAYSVWEGKTSVGEFRKKVAFDTNADPQIVSLWYKGHNLRDDHLPLKDYGVRHNSEVSAMLTVAARADATSDGTASGHVPLDDQTASRPTKGDATAQKQQPQAETAEQKVSQKNADGKYPCPKCTKSYLHSKHLKRHMLRHTGDRPYMCVLCKDTFSRSDILKRHFQKCAIRIDIPRDAQSKVNSALDASVTPPPLPTPKRSDIDPLAARLIAEENFGGPAYTSPFNSDGSMAQVRFKHLPSASALRRGSGNPRVANLIADEKPTAFIQEEMAHPFGSQTPEQGQWEPSTPLRVDEAGPSTNTSTPGTTHSPRASANRALEDYQMQLMLLEKQVKHRTMGCIALLDALLSHPSAWPFLPPVRNEFMDLQGLRRGLTQHQFPNAKELAFRLRTQLRDMFDVCRVRDPPVAGAVEAADDLERYMETRIDELKLRKFFEGGE